jgi:hypothetical protein
MGMRMSTAPSRMQRVPLQQETSRIAFREHDRETLSQRILRHLEMCGDEGATDCELEAALGGALHSAVSADRRHLVEKGLVHASDLRRPTPRGRPAVVWRAGKGPQVAPFVVPNPITEQLNLEGMR